MRQSADPWCFLWLSPAVQKRVWINWQGLHRESWQRYRTHPAHRLRSHKNSLREIWTSQTERFHCWRFSDAREGSRRSPSAPVRARLSVCAFALAFTFAYARALQLVLKTPTLHIPRLVFCRSAAASRFTYFHILHVILIHGTQSAVAGAPVRERRRFHRTLALLGFSPAS